MKFPSLKAFGVITMLSLVAAVLIAQTNPGPTAPAWHWTRIYGQSVQVFGVLSNGRIKWAGEWRGDAKVAPAEVERRKSALLIDQPPIIPPGSSPSPQTAPATTPAPLNYGVNIEEMRGDGRTIRASDPETLAAVRAVVDAKRPRQPEYCEVHGTDKCPNGGGCRKPDPPEPERKPGIIERAEIEMKTLLTYAVAALVAAAAVFLVVQSNRPKS